MSIIFLIVLPICAYPQMEPAIRPQGEDACDTINIDECYIIRNEKKIVIDTNVQETIVGLFTILKVVPLYPNYCMLYVTHTDTIYTVYDSTIDNGSLVYPVDTSYSTHLYNVLVEKEEDVGPPLNYWVNLLLSEYEYEENIEKNILLHLRSFYNNVKMPTIHGIVPNDNFATTVNCEQCQVIILHGKEEKVFDCPIYNNLYRLK